MPRKKVTTVTEEIDAPTEPTYEEIHKDDIDEVARKAAESDAEAIKNPIEEKAAELQKAPKEEEKPDFELEELDTDKLKKEAADAAKQEILSALQGDTAKETKENKDEYEEWRKSFVEEHGKEPSWSQAADFIKEKAKREMREEDEAQKKAAEAEQAKIADQQKQNEKITNEFIDRELEELYADGKLPKILDQNDKNDPGVVARKALFQTMLEVNQKNQAEGKPLEYSVYKIFTKYYKSPRRQPAGADAPVSAGSSNGPATSDDEVKYTELKKPWYQFIRDVTHK